MPRPSSRARDTRCGIARPARGWCRSLFCVRPAHRRGRGHHHHGRAVCHPSAGSDASSSGDRALIETPTYPHAAEALRGAGASWWACRCRRRGGTSIARSRRSPAHARASPTSCRGSRIRRAARWMSPKRRRTPMLRRAGTVLIIDETTADLAIDVVPEPLPSLQKSASPTSGRPDRFARKDRVGRPADRMGACRPRAGFAPHRCAPGARSRHTGVRAGRGRARCGAYADVLAQRAQLLGKVATRPCGHSASGCRTGASPTLPAAWPCGSSSMHR
jgi:hypothetical protein